MDRDKQGYTVVLLRILFTSPINLLVGTSDLSNRQRRLDKRTFIEIKRKIIHPKYDAGKLQNNND